MYDFFLCWSGVMYSGEYDACDVTLSVYPQYRASLKNMPGHGGNRIYDLWNTIIIIIMALFPTFQ